MDFGLARQCTPLATQLTTAGLVLGTPAYMPPEQIEGDVARIGPACDIYSLGVILYELLIWQRTVSRRHDGAGHANHRGYSAAARRGENRGLIRSLI